MNISTLLLFSATVIPLVCTLGPTFFRRLAGGVHRHCGARTAGIILGYCVHSLLVALGLAAVVAASPLLFEIIRWTGISYLVFLAAKLVRAAMPRRPARLARAGQGSAVQGLPDLAAQPEGDAGLPGDPAAIHGPAAGQYHRRRCCCRRRSCSGARWCIRRCASDLADGGGSLSELRRRLIDGTAGGMILLAAGSALAHR